jgi:7-alpha-hydroxysteroid dehydrogenase
VPGTTKQASPTKQAGPTKQASPTKREGTENRVSILDRFRVDGQVALVTGASRGIGHGSAIALAEAGADVVLASRTPEDVEAAAEEVRALGRRAVAVPLDVMELDRLGELVEAATSELGRLDILVNNAGGSFPKPLLDTSARSFEKAFTFNVTTAFELTKAAVPAMLESGGGSVVNISSAAGRMADRGFAAYGTAKGALSHLTKIMAMDLCPHIRVNGIAVGSVATDALATVLEGDLREQMEAATPLRRLGEVEDISAAVLYLSSPAGSYMTGKLLEVDGGIDHPTLALGLPDYEPG